MHVVFDLDGCLIDTTELIKQSYQAAGVTPPDDVLNHEGHQWLIDQCTRDKKDVDEVYAAKNAHYLSGIAGDAPVMSLPPWDAAEHLRTQGHHVFILSGAPRGTMLRLRRRFDSFSSGKWPFVISIDGMRTADKVRWLDLHVRAGVYVDDQEVKVPADWRFVRYSGQGVRELLQEIGRS